MADNLTKAKRTRVMTAIRGRGNRTTELAMAKVLRRAGLRGWRRHVALPGTPDFCWPRLSVALFVDGCFWHGCPRHYQPPSTRRTFWRDKVISNQARDRRVSAELRALGWRVLRVWECRVEQASTVHRISATLATAPEVVTSHPR